MEYNVNIDLALDSTDWRWWAELSSSEYENELSFKKVRNFLSGWATINFSGWICSIELFCRINIAKLAVTGVTNMVHETKPRDTAIRTKVILTLPMFWPVNFSKNHLTELITSLKVFLYYRLLYHIIILFTSLSIYTLYILHNLSYGLITISCGNYQFRRVLRKYLLRIKHEESYAFNTM
jgi:hypothetical protein